MTIATKWKPLTYSAAAPMRLQQQQSFDDLAKRQTTMKHVAIIEKPVEAAPSRPIRSGGDENSGLPRKPKWRKILYEEQPFEDNYVDSQFMKGHQRYFNVEPYSYWALVDDACHVAQQFHFVIIFLCSFFFMWEGSVSSLFIIMLSLSIIVFGLAAYVLSVSNPAAEVSTKLGRKSYETVLLCGLLFVFSPILKTLTQQFESDSVWTLTGSLLVLHLFFMDYKFVAMEDSLELNASLSLNAAFLAAVVLGSRLSTSIAVFALLLLAGILFGMSPFLRKRIRANSTESHRFVTLAIFVISNGALLPVSTLGASINVFASVFTVFVAPRVLMIVSKYKKYVVCWDRYLSLCEGHYLFVSAFFMLDSLTFPIFSFIQCHARTLGYCTDSQCITRRT